MVFKTVLSLITIGVSGLVRLVFSVLVGRVFGTAALGHVNTIISIAMFATLVCSPGLGQAVARYLARTDSDGSTATGRSVLVLATAAHHVVCLVLAVVVAMVIPAERWQDRALALGLTVGYGAYTYYKAVLYGVDRVERYAFLELSWDALFVLAMVALVVTRAHFWILAPLVLVYAGFSIGAQVSLIRRLGAGRPGRPDAGVRRAVLAFAAVTTVGTVSSAGFLQLSQVFALRAGGANGAGLFAAAMTLVTPAYLLPRAISVVLFPAMARAAGREDRETHRRQLVLGTQVLAAAMLPAFALVGMVATGLLTLIYGVKFADGGPTLTVMIWATWVSVACVPAVNALSSDTGRAYMVPAAASVAGFAVGLVLWLVVGSSIQAVAWAYLVGSVLQSAVPVIESWRRYRAPGASLMIRLMLVAGGALLAGVLLGHLSGGLELMVGLVAAGAAAAVVFPELRVLARMRFGRVAS